MYNLLVTSREGDWDKGHYEFDKSRILEYTNEKIALALKDLTSSNIDKLKSYPTVFAYEGENSNFQIGSIQSITERGRNILIEFEFREDISPIPFEKIKPIAPLLDIRSWEMNRTHWAVKEENLFARLRKIGIKVNETTLKNFNQGRPTADKSKNPKITTVQGFIGKVLSLEERDGNEVFYRGHSDKIKYKLEPSLFRRDEEGNYLYKDNEHVIYRELLVSNSADFQSDVYTLDSLVRMQHYSLPTRLLDITSNPLIALYFACKSSINKEGEVVVFSMNRKNVKYFDSDVASCVANLARLPQTEKGQIDFDNEGFNKQPAIKRLLHFIKEEKPFFEPSIKPEDLRRIICVKGKHSNDRISSQSGAFLLFGLDAVFDEEGTPDISVSRITVTNKNSILEELDLLNINESTVFPYIENSAKYVAQKFKFDKARSSTTKHDG
ncbi:FRG domain-containing protein [Alteromonas mediterranea]|uniref:FRG domain-containing protein n=1 Tax=Alteromonas mediterranea TaxID=314275 RepID=UPI0012FBE5D3|nr:FRG domain-containing protein [Alteromonas mediterranea]QGX61692.1 FRG domain-containing protein [Alteromonas mediterranea]